MFVARQHLHLVTGDPHMTADALGTDGDLGDMVLTITIFAISFLPIVSAIAHPGHWGDGTLGLGAAGSMLAGRELWARAKAALRARMRAWRIRLRRSSDSRSPRSRA
jgi:hypothetical protein